MTKRIALLRGVNVGGRTRITMADLRALLAGMGFEAVRTHLQSGNAVFDAPGPWAPDEEAARIERRIADDLGVSVTVLLRSAGSLARTLAASPYLGQEDDPARLYVTFLARQPTAEQAARLAVPAGESAVFTLAGDEVHLHVPDGYGRTKLDNAFFERRLGIPATTRNWRTVNALYKLAAEG
ncbi:DUF1697 domain-containing protein [Streptomyces sp. SCL15-4]|uniref:DUF1697 domain-containing protein n=1 Tax=Streptomyces sp. SCL15-4 TaxID=2967221 RepID=UPI0029661C73|nr:DUF1697 domain-containing protein [Streptomyces sp. SCL15-4]